MNNEPRYLDPLLRTFIQWDVEMEDSHSGEGSKRMVWEERYVLLSWLSHLLLAPFDLSSMASDDIAIAHDNLGQLGVLSCKTPPVAKSLLSVAMRYAVAPRKEREAATVLLVRLALRQDMQSYLLERLIEWAFQTLQPQSSAELPSVDTYLGLLSFLARLGASGQLENVAPFIVPVFERTMRIAQEDSDTARAIRASALARKTLIKILRTFVMLAYSLNERPDRATISDDKLSSMLEDTIDHFLVSLADDDIPVRLAASKALSIVTLRLDADMAADVIEAILASLEENILYEKQDGTLLTQFEARNAGIASLKRNISAVDARRWHGLLLTLAHLLFRHAPPSQQLSSILQSLLSGLVFEQRSLTGSSVGTGVRDASCFGIWSLARKYTTCELLALELVHHHHHHDHSTERMNAVQILAIELVCAACVDPSGNIRRGASAALQELVGRHPDTVVEGIPLVQVVDYFAVARRSRAMISVASSAASIDHLCWSPLVDSLMHWRGIGSPDAESRRQAAKAIGTLSTQDSYKTMAIILTRLKYKLANISPRDVEIRHGCLLSIAATVDAYTKRQASRDASDYVSHQIAGLWETVFDSSCAPTTEDLTLQAARPELTAEAVSRLIYSLSRPVNQLEEMPRPSTLILNEVFRVLSLCISRMENTVIEPASEALSNVFRFVSPARQAEAVKSLISNIQSTSKSTTGRGYILALGALSQQIEPETPLKELIIRELLCYSEKDEFEKKVVAVKCLATKVLPHIGIVSIFPLKCSMLCADIE